MILRLYQVLTTLAGLLGWPYFYWHLKMKFLERLKLILGYSQRNAFLPAGIERRDGAQAPITRPRSKAHVCGTRR